VSGPISNDSYADLRNRAADDAGQFWKADVISLAKRRSPGEIAALLARYGLI